MSGTIHLGDFEPGKPHEHTMMMIMITKMMRMMIWFVTLPVMTTLKAVDV